MFYLTRHGKEYSRCLKILHGFTRNVIQKKKKSFEASSSPDKKSKRLAFLDMLLNVSDEGKALSSEDIQEEVDTFMFEGRPIFGTWCLCSYYRAKLAYGAEESKMHHKYL